MNNENDSYLHDIGDMFRMVYDTDMADIVKGISEANSITNKLLVKYLNSCKEIAILKQENKELKEQNEKSSLSLKDNLNEVIKELNIKIDKLEESNSVSNKLLKEFANKFSDVQCINNVLEKQVKELKQENDVLIKQIEEINLKNVAKGILPICR